MKSKNDFKDVADLARLPYFSLTGDGKQLKYKGDSGDFIDFHTHVSCNYFLGIPADLFGDCDTQTFFPFKGERLSVEGYSALSFSKKLISNTRQETVRQAFINRGIAKSHTFPNLEKEMALLKFARTVILPVEIFYSRNTDRIFSHKDKIKDKHILFASVDPKMPGALKKFEKHFKNGARGLKLHPLMQTVRPVNKNVIALCRKAGEIGIPVLFHSGWGPLIPGWQKRYSDFGDFEKLVKMCPETKIILGHAGSLSYKEAINIAFEYENVYLELSGQCPSSIKKMIKILGDDRLLFGSDWPYYPMAFPMAKVLLATEGKPKSREKIMKLNAKKLLGI
jgi:predicted TIM-barrel fold metal-dependent hydrolase